TIGAMRSISATSTPWDTAPSRSGEIERLDPHEIARGYVARVLVDDDEAVGLDHRGEDAGALGTRGRDAPTLAVVGEDAALELPPPALLPHPLRGHGAEPGHVELAPSRELPQRRAHEQVKRQHRRHRIAGEPEEMGGTDLAHRDRAARLHRDLPEIDSP